MTISQTFNFMQAMKDARLAERTRKEYQRRVNRWKDYLDGRQLDRYQVTSSDVLAYQQDLLQRESSKWTVNSFIIAIRAFYKFARKAGMLNYDPTSGVRGLKTDQPVIPKMSSALRKRWWDWAMTLRPNARAGFSTMIGAGLKVGEAANLRPRDVELDHDCLFLNIRHSQFARDRRVPVMDLRAAKIIYAYWKPLRNTAAPLFRIQAPAFHWHAKRFAVQQHLQFNCHMLRRDFAIRMCKRGITIPALKKVLGHSSNLQTFYYTLADDDGDVDISPDFRIDDDDSATK